MKLTVWAAAAICVPGVAVAQAQPAPQQQEQQQGQPPAPPVLMLPPVEMRRPEPELPPGEGTILPAGAPLIIALDQDIDSYDYRRGQRIRLRLVQPVKVGDVVLLPAGLTGEGEIIHSEPAGDGGRPGELILAARFLNYRGRQIPVKGWRLVAKGHETVTPGYNVITYTGYPAIIPRGRRAESELAADFDLRRAAGATPPVPGIPPRLASPPTGLVAPALGKAQVVFYRPASMNGMLNWTKIRFGPGKGAEIGRLGTGGYITIDVPPGRHQFMVSQELGDVLHLEAEAGETYYVGIRIHTGIWAGHPNLYPVTRGTFEESLGGMSRKPSVWKGG